MRMALYARVSTYGQNLDTQRRLLERHAKAQEWDYDFCVESQSFLALITQSRWKQ